MSCTHCPSLVIYVVNSISPVSLRYYEETCRSMSNDSYSLILIKVIEKIGLLI